MYTPRSAVLKVALSKMRLRVSQPTARYVMLVIVLPTVGDSGMFLVLLVSVAMVLMILGMLERFP